MCKGSIISSRIFQNHMYSIISNVVIVLMHSRRFAARITWLLICAWMTLFFVNSTLALLPISLGRALFKSLSELPIMRGAKCNGEEACLYTSLRNLDVNILSYSDSIF